MKFIINKIKAIASAVKRFIFHPIASIESACSLVHETFGSTALVLATVASVGLAVWGISLANDGLELSTGWQEIAKNSGGQADSWREIAHEAVSVAKEAGADVDIVGVSMAAGYLPVPAA